MPTVSRARLDRSPISLKPLSRQVIVLTGVAGRAADIIACKAAREGAAIVMADTDEQRLHRVEEEIRQFSDAVLAVPLAGYDEGELHRLAQGALVRYGRIDSWIDSLEPRLSTASANGSGGSHETPSGIPGLTLACSRVALEYLASKGGAMVTVAVPGLSGDTLVPEIARLLDAVGIHCCTLRKELERKELPVAMTLIRPAPGDETFASHGWKAGAASRSHDLSCPDEAVAAAALYATQHPARDIYVGIAAAPATLRYTPCDSKTNILHLTVPLRRGTHSSRQTR